MQTKAEAAGKTAWKYLFWTAVAAVLQTLINELPKVELPPIWIPIIGAALKSVATWVTTQQD